MTSKKRPHASLHDDVPPSHAPYALYGNPLPAYDSNTRDDGSFLPVWKQEVTDERGRKRLHGAFTGGFSAGYFNTVGSKEGWTPSTFVSSRSNRAKKDEGAGQRVEDFMDEEDLAEREESIKLETQGGFAGLGRGEGDGSGKGMFADLFRTTGETMGVKLLQRMGWRQGQGVGPKVRRKAKGDEKGDAHFFAPENSRMISFNRKTDRKGLGFQGEGRLDNFSQPQHPDDEDERDARILQNRSRPKVSLKPDKPKKSSLGVGVLNDTGSDDEDPYSMGPQISYNRSIGADKKKKKGGLVSSNAVPVKPNTFPSKKLTQRTSTSAGFRKCHDGRLPLEGFVLSLSPLSLTDEPQYAPPIVPEGWKPKPLSSVSNPDSAAFVSTSDAAKASILDPKSRAALLGEQQLPGKSIFDFLTPAARERLASASGRNDLPQARGEKAPAGFESSAAERNRTLWDLVPQLDKATAAAALQRGSTGFMPYAEDTSKRERYRDFLELRAGVHASPVLPPRPGNFSTDEWVKEMNEFVQAASVFRPISGLMASRFTTSTTSGPRLATDAPDKSPTVPSEREQDPAEKAAGLGMYGPLTRAKLPFYPSRLLCKRFGVKPPAHVAPEPGAGEDGKVPEDKRLEVVSQASLDRMVREAGWNNATASRPQSGVMEGANEEATGKGAAEGMGASSAHQQREEVDPERNEALEGQKAGEAVFRAIFGDDDSDEE